MAVSRPSTKNSKMNTQGFDIRVQQTDQGWCAEALGQLGIATNPLMAVCVWMKNARTAGELLLIAANPQPVAKAAPRAEQPNLPISTK
jgi:hypothetical protein